jgi:hypothetical protein
VHDRIMLQMDGTAATLTPLLPRFRHSIDATHLAVLLLPLTLLLLPGRLHSALHTAAQPSFPNRLRRRLRLIRALLRCRA